MPYAQCPDCHNWSPSDQWPDAPNQDFPFRIACPNCGVETDVSDVPYRLYDPTDGTSAPERGSQ